MHLTTGPLYHSGPLAFASLAHTLGAPIVVLRKFDAARVARPRDGAPRHEHVLGADAAEAHRAACPPSELAQADLSSMLCLIANAAPVPYALKQEIIAKLGDGFLYEVYGSTELGVDTVLKPEDQLRKPGSCGKTVRRHRGAHRHATTAPSAGRGEPGELFVRTDARDGRLPPHRRAADRARRRASGSRSATSRTSTTRATSTSATARRT